MDRTRRRSAGSLCEHVRRSAVGFSGQSFRFAKGFWWEKLKTGLKRSGKSCRLRWVNYLQPGLKRGKITPQEEHLILQLHSKWGNRWSKIAQKLPGRTDNEIKNYWRTHMRKKANEERTKCGSSSSSSSLSNSSSSSGGSSSPPAVDSGRIPETNERNFYDTRGLFEEKTQQFETEGEKMVKKIDEEIQVYSSSMDDIWKEMELWEEDNTKMKAEQQKGGCRMWSYWSDLLWTMNMDCSNQGQSSNVPEGVIEWVEHA